MNNSALMAMTIMGGLLSATLSFLHLLPFPGLIFLSYFSTLPLFLIGLGIGLRPLYGAGLVATFLILLVEGPLSTGEFLIFSVLGPAFLINRALLNRKLSSGKITWYPSSLLLRDLTLISGVIMLLALGIFFYLTNGENIHTLIQKLLKVIDPQGHMKSIEPVLVRVFPLLPGFFALSWMGMMLINAVLAQGLLVRFNWNLRPSPSFEDLKVPQNFLIFLGIFLLLSIIGIGFIELLGKNAIFILVFPFFLVGLSLIHHWTNKSPFRTTILTLFYFLLFVFVWPVLIITLLGILKPWVEKLPSLN